MELGGKLNRNGEGEKFVSGNCFSRLSKKSDLSSMALKTIRAQRNKHESRNFGKVRARELCSSIYLESWVEFWAKLESTYIPRYQKLSFRLSRSNVIRDVDSGVQHTTGSMVITEVIHSAMRTETTACGHEI